MRLRPSARVVLLDREARVLLLLLEDPPYLRPGQFWVLPGGGLEDGESFERGARRELWEQTGIKLDAIGPCIWTRILDPTLKGQAVRSVERYFLARVEASEVVTDAQPDAVEHAHYRGFRWWRVEEMASSGEQFLPPELAIWLLPIVHGEVPAEPINRR